MKQQNKKSKEQNSIQNSFGKFGQMEENNINSDILGSYTGNPEDGERPIQDADDL